MPIPVYIMAAELILSIPYFISAIVFALGASIMHQLSILNHWSSKTIKYTKIIFLVLSVINLIFFAYLFVNGLI